MKKLICLGLAVLLFSIVSNVNAAEIEKSIYDGNFKIEGTGTGQIQVVLFDLDNNPIYLTTVNATDGKFAIVLPEISELEKGNYKVKVADYDGLNSDSKDIAVDPVAVKKNPQTYDNIMLYVLIMTLSVIGLFSIKLISKKHNKVN